MRLLLAVIAFAVMMPVAHADDEELPPNDTSTSTGTLCIQTIEGPTVCK